MKQEVKVVDEHFATIEVNGVQHTLVDEVDQINTCIGCAFDERDQYGYQQCRIPIIGAMTSMCAQKKAIWRPISISREDNKFTVKEVIEVLVDDLDMIPLVYATESLFLRIEQLIKRNRDPEYIEYLRLKAKFE